MKALLLLPYSLACTAVAKATAEPRHLRRDGPCSNDSGLLALSLSPSPSPTTRLPLDASSQLTSKMTPLLANFHRSLPLTVAPSPGPAQPPVSESGEGIESSASGPALSFLPENKSKRIEENENDASLDLADLDSQTVGVFAVVFLASAIVASVGTLVTVAVILLARRKGRGSVDGTAELSDDEEDGKSLGLPSTISVSSASSEMSELGFVPADHAKHLVLAKEEARALRRIGALEPGPPHVVLERTVLHSTRTGLETTLEIVPEGVAVEYGCDEHSI